MAISSKIIATMQPEIATPVCGLVRNDSGKRRLDAIFVTIVCPVISSYYHTPYKRKKSPFPLGNKDRKYDFCGTTLLAGKSGRLCPVPTHRLPLNAGNASEDTLA